MIFWWSAFLNNKAALEVKLLDALGSKSIVLLFYVLVGLTCDNGVI